MKILLITPSLRSGGSERVINELANYWAKNEKNEVYLMLLTKHDVFYKPSNKICLITPNSNYKSNPFSKFIFKIKTIHFIRKQCNKIKPDTILSFGERYNNIVLFSLLNTRYPIFVSDRNSPYWNIGVFHDVLRKILYRYASGIIAQTLEAKKILQEKTKNKKIEVIANPLRNIQTYEKIKRKDEKVILNVGRIVEQKNQIELIEIFNYLQQDNDGWKLIIIGEGPLKNKLINKIKQLGLENKIELIDATNEIDHYYSHADIFAFSSLFEGFPNALCEALAHGLACISYDCPTGPRNLITNNINGFLVEPNNKKEFAAKLNQLMNSEVLRQKFSENSKNTKKTYSVENISDQYLNFINPKTT